MTKYVFFTKSVLSSFSIMTMLLFSIGWVANASAADKMYGVFMVVKGSVKVQTNSAGAGIEAKVGSKIFEGDSVSTAVDSRAKIVMSDRNVINLSPETQIKITKYQNNSATGAKNVEMNLLSGKVRNDVEQSYDGEKNKFLIKTPTAVAGVRGTKLITSLDKMTGATSVYTIQGSVAVASLGKNGMVIGAPVMVNKGEMTTAAPNQKPEIPKLIPKEEMKKAEQESLASLGPKTDKAAVRDVASEGGSNANPAAAPAMLDKKDLDVEAIAKDIPAGARLPNAQPMMPKGPDASPVDTRPKTTKVIVHPTPSN